MHFLNVKNNTCLEMYETLQKIECVYLYIFVWIKMYLFPAES